ncbi:hypothetical protein GcM1_216006 [Golovinomyces cichoracearum]|uniref:Nucleic acid-binding protein n=1 Tax=Golovinomyces cichoracearum TaxID=62708 RepID=A0A420IT85_9PEZI|nr:hypothetical protein GcM1_216006 [Golovinomyces cichoracearum]
MPPKIIFFTGAPEARSMKWDESDLLSKFQPSIASFCGIEEAENELGSATESLPSWRLLPVQPYEVQYNTKIYSQTHNSKGEIFESSQIGSSFTSSMSSPPQDLHPAPLVEGLIHPQPLDQVLSQFYEESYVYHENTKSFLSTKIVLTPVSSICSTESNVSQDTESSPEITLLQQRIPVPSQLTDLKDIPTSAYLDSIYPQTISCNIIVGIISISEARSIKTRRGFNVELIKILVGDPTKSGFTINFWLPPLLPRKFPGDLRNMLSIVQTHDVILVQNMALSSFQGNVYGQSLKKEVTKIYLLDRNSGFESISQIVNDVTNHSMESDNQNLQLTKTKQVREWLLEFVGSDSTLKVRNGRICHKTVLEQLPPDSQ